MGTPALCSAPVMATNFANLLSWRSATGEGGPTSARIAASSGGILAIPSSKVTGGFAVDLVINSKSARVGSITVPCLTRNASAVRDLGELRFIAVIAILLAM